MSDELTLQILNVSFDVALVALDVALYVTGCGIGFGCYMLYAEYRDYTWTCFL